MELNASNGELHLNQTILDAICDPITFEPFEDAQELNCNKDSKYGGHHLDLKTCIKIFGEMAKKCATPGPCPTCRGHVTKYKPNPGLQRVVNAIIGVDNGREHVEKMHAMIREMQVNKKLDDRSSYSLAPALFGNSRNFPGFVKKDSFEYTLINTGNEENCIDMIDIVKNKYGFLFTIYFYSSLQLQQFKQDLVKLNHNKLPIRITSEVDRSACHYFHLRTKKINKFMKCLNYIIENNKFTEAGQMKVTDLTNKLNNHKPASNLDNNP